MQCKNTYCRAELDVRIIRKKPKVEHFLKIIHVIFEDELGQLSDEEITVYDYILRQFRGGTFFMGVILMIGALYNLQIQPIDDRFQLNISTFSTRALISGHHRTGTLIDQPIFQLF